MSPQVDEAVVLRLTEYSETSQIMTLFSSANGLLRLIAKGSRRGTKTRFATGLDLLEYGEVRFVGAHGDAQLGTLTEWVQRDTFSGLRGEAVRLYGALYAVELVGGLTEEGDPHVELFTALVETLRALAAGAPAGSTIAGFQNDLLTSIGYVPDLQACVDCRRAVSAGQPAFFSARAGGLLCRDCEIHHVEKRRLPSRLHATTPRTGDAYEWFVLLDYHITHVAGRRFKTAEPLGKLMAKAARRAGGADSQR